MSSGSPDVVWVCPACRVEYDDPSLGTCPGCALDNYFWDLEPIVHCPRCQRSYSPDNAVCEYCALRCESCGESIAFTEGECSWCDPMCPSCREALDDDHVCANCDRQAPRSTAELASEAPAQRQQPFASATSQTPRPSPIIRAASATKPRTTTPWQQNAVIILLIGMCCCAPLGLVLVWTNRQWPIKTKWIMTGLIVGSVAALMLISSAAQGPKN